ncbi:MAG: hypothetical protein R3312_06650 [Gammaproteobacteria bacterium]|nr:hypothetical protein [Gammaproteobacteria bacterium]
MKGLALSSLLVLTVASTVHAQEAADTEQLYTGFNIWVLSKSQRHNQRFINYKRGGNILPAGTPIYNVQALKSPPGSGFMGGDDSDFPGPHVYFETKDGTSYEILFKSGWHPGKTLDDYKNYLATSKNFDQLTEGLTATEKEAIKKGAVVVGMSKEGVLISYGPPAEHRTPSWDSNEWLYWTGKTSTKKICFDASEKATRCGDVTSAEEL